MFIEEKDTGDTLTASEFNQLPEEIQDVISAAGLTPTFDVLQLLSSVSDISRYEGLCTDSGVPDAYILTSDHTSATSYTDGMIIRFETSGTNSGGPATLDLDGIASRSIKAAYGSSVNPPAGSISGFVTLIYDGTSFGIYGAKEPVQNDIFVQGWNVGITATFDLVGMDSSDHVIVGDITADETRIVAASGLGLYLGSETTGKVLTATADASVSFYYDNVQSLKTADHSSAARTSGAQVTDATGVIQDVGFNTIDSVPFVTTNATIIRDYAGKSMDYVGAGGNTFTLDTDGDLPVNYTVMITNRSSGDLNIDNNALTLSIMDGSGTFTNGDVVMAAAGIATLRKVAAGQYIIFGSGLTYL